MRRRKMNKRKSKRVFRKGSKTRTINIRAKPWRGGFRF